MEEITTKHENLMERSEIEEGQKVVCEFTQLYNWAAENEGYSRKFVGVVEDIDFVGDIRIKAESGESFKDMGGNYRYVQGKAENSPDVPNFTDIGMGFRYYKLE